MLCSFSYPHKKTEPKEGALPCLTLRVDDTAGARRNSLRSDSRRAKSGDESRIMLSGKAQGKARSAAIV
jgi:hypothetical protein